MKTGKVKFFNETKGFGFIKEENGQEIFVHVTGLKEKIKDQGSKIFMSRGQKSGYRDTCRRI